MTGVAALVEDETSRLRDFVHFEGCQNGHFGPSWSQGYPDVYKVGPNVSPRCDLRSSQPEPDVSISVPTDLCKHGSSKVDPCWNISSAAIDWSVLTRSVELLQVTSGHDTEHVTYRTPRTWSSDIPRYGTGSCTKMLQSCQDRLTELTYLYEHDIQDWFSGNTWRIHIGWKGWNWKMELTASVNHATLSCDVWNESTDRVAMWL